MAEKHTVRGFQLRTWHCICEIKYNFYILHMEVNVKGTSACEAKIVGTVWQENIINHIVSQWVYCMSTFRWK